MDRDQAYQTAYTHQVPGKRRERVVISDLGGVMKKIVDPEECRGTITLPIRKYIAKAAVLLCKGVVNTKRLFVLNDDVEEICPCTNVSGKAFIVVRKAISRKAKMYYRTLNEILPFMKYVEDTTMTFAVTKRGFTKTDGIECLCIEPVPGSELWVDKDFGKESSSTVEQPQQQQQQQQPLPPQPQPPETSSETLLKDNEPKIPFIPQLHCEQPGPIITMDTYTDVTPDRAAAPITSAVEEDAVENGDVPQETQGFTSRYGIACPMYGQRYVVPGMNPLFMGMNLRPMYTRIADGPINANNVNGMGMGMGRRQRTTEQDEFARGVLDDDDDDDDCTGFADNF